MIVMKKLGFAIFTGIIVLCGMELGERLSVPGIHSFIPVAEARVGRPLTPVSVAGVGRRTTRRCVTGVYDC
jgi:hypothetical protein